MSEAFVRLIDVSQAKKLGPIATTYRAGSTSPFDTCPSTCGLLPKYEHGTPEIDFSYLETVIKSVPRNGLAWTYTHFPYHHIPKYNGGTVINISTDDLDTALQAADAGYPTVFAAPVGWTHKSTTINGRRFVTCPEYTHPGRIKCFNCGGGKPLCARPKRDYVIVFPAHGTGAKLVGHNERGGCYGSYGNVRIQWERTAKAEDSGKIIGSADIHEVLPSWTNSLPYGSFLRHHIVGDLGKARTTLPPHFKSKHDAREYTEPSHKPKITYSGTRVGNMENAVGRKRRNTG